MELPGFPSYSAKDRAAVRRAEKLECMVWSVGKDQAPRSAYGVGDLGGMHTSDAVCGGTGAGYKERVHW